MEKFINYLGPLALAAVVIVLLLGLINMMRGGSSSRSQMFMRWRVILQLFAIIVLMLGLYLSSR